MKKYTMLFLLLLLFATNMDAKNKDNLPSIQKAWVDTGYFTWKDSTKTSLQITELGAKQETLPDVRDGEQLTDASFMFATLTDSNNRSCKLNKAPLFNTSNITNFYGMFHECYSLQTLPKYDTSKGINFARMFSSCVSLETIPLLDTSNGKNFNNMFANDLLLKTVPKLNTSNGEDFSFMFFRCLNLIEVSDLVVSNGTDLEYMFYECKNLKYKPSFVISKNANIELMYGDTSFEND